MGGRAVDDKELTLASNDFELFGVAQQFAQDGGALDARWKELQREAHPDRHAAKPASEQRRAMQWSVRINEAYQRLRDPLRRAAYMCELGGAAVNATNNTAMPAEFLMQQMEWREALDAAHAVGEVETLRAEVQTSRRAVLARCEELLDTQRDPVRAVAQVRALMFIERFGADIDARLEHFESLASEPADSATPIANDQPKPVR